VALETADFCTSVYNNVEFNFAGVRYYCSICNIRPHCGGAPYRAHEYLRNSVPCGHFLPVVCVCITHRNSCAKCQAAVC